MDELSSLRPASLAEWRHWLAEHHATAPGVWLFYAKKGTGQPTVTYDESVREALCFGWIDGLMRSVDETWYKRRFTPRRPGSNWSPSNRQRVAELEGTGRMTPAGQAVVDAARADGSFETPTDAARTAPVTEPTPEFRQALNANTRALTAFEALTPGRQRTYCRWIAAAKREETKARRIAEALASLAEGRALGMK